MPCSPQALLVNFDCNCLWVKDAGPLKEALSLTPVYLRGKGNTLDLKARSVAVVAGTNAKLGTKRRRLRLCCYAARATLCPVIQAANVPRHLQGLVFAPVSCGYSLVRAARPDPALTLPPSIRRTGLADPAGAALQGAQVVVCAANLRRRGPPRLCAPQDGARQALCTAGASQFYCTKSDLAQLQD